MSETLENTPETFEKLINEVNAFKDKYLRVVAESDNYRKRVERDKETALKFANERLAKDLLETLDNFENALKVEMPDEVRLGIELIYNSLTKTLQKHKVVECMNEMFDPNFHEAVSKVDVGLEPNTITAVLRKGYVLHDRLLRPTSVVIQG